MNQPACAPRFGRLTLSLWIWGAVAVVGHAAYANTPFVNLEFAFSEAARGLADPDYAAGVQKYWTCQANPLGYSAIAAGLLQVLPDAVWVHRLPALGGTLAILLAGYFLCREIGSRGTAVFSLWSALTVLNPLIWIYGGRATADVLPAGLVCLAAAAAYRARGCWQWHLLAGTLFAIATVVKFNTALLGLGFVYLVLAASEQATLREKLAGLACYTLVPGLVLGSYLLWTWRTFGVLLVAAGPQATFNASGFAGQFPVILMTYLSYLVMLSGLLALLVPMKLIGRLSRTQAWTLFAAAGGLAAVGSSGLLNFHGGEMDYGGFDRMLPPALFMGLKVAGAALAALFVIDLWQNAVQRRDRFAAFLASAVIPYLVISSFFRPAQRYLILCLPCVLLYLLMSMPDNLQRLSRRLGWVTAGTFALISFAAVVYQVAQGEAAENMAQWILQRGYLARTSPGAILPHAGQHFPVEDRPTNRLIVQTQPDEACLHSEPVRVFGHVLRTYYLCPRPQPVEINLPLQTARELNADEPSAMR